MQIDIKDLLILKYRVQLGCTISSA